MSKLSQPHDSLIAKGRAYVSKLLQPYDIDSKVRRYRLIRLIYSVALVIVVVHLSVVQLDSVSVIEWVVLGLSMIGMMLLISMSTWLM